MLHACRTASYKLLTFTAVRTPPPIISYTPLTGCATYRIHLINRFISFNSCQILSPSKTGFIVSAHRLTKITLLILVQATL